MSQPQAQLGMQMKRRNHLYTDTDIKMVLVQTMTY